MRFNGSVFAAGAAFLVLLATIRVVLTYSITSQGFDEPCHVAAGIEFLDLGSYTLDPVHPTLARIAISLPLYLAGERFPDFPPDDRRRHDYNEVGNKILYAGGHYRHNLNLARCGVLPFFILTCLITFLWSRREFGDLIALIAVALLTTLPAMLAFSSLAYTDIVAACTQCGAIFAFAIWLDRPTKRSCALLGAAVGFALLSKFTSLIFLPAAAISILVCKRLLTDGGSKPETAPATIWIKQSAVALLVAALLVWGGYRFSFGHVRESMQLSAESMPSFQHFPAPIRIFAQEIILRDPSIPAPALIHGLAEAWVLNKIAPTSYLLGRTKSGGWWYFFLVGIAVKTPIPFLLLSLVGFYFILRSDRRGPWTQLAPAASAIAILIVTMPVKYNVGVRHVLVVFPLLAIVAAAGAASLWQIEGRWRVAGQSLVVALVIWQGVSTIRASSDYIAYFNELAGSDPSRVLVTGCDLDCGQDVFRLSERLRARNISHLNIAVWSSADMSQMGLPTFDTPQPFQPVSGWVAISARSLRFGDLFHTTYPPNAFSWIESYKPVEHIGKTIQLYYIPEYSESKERPDSSHP